MAKAHPIWSNFTGGEFSPLLEGRVDLSKYFNACRKLQNMLVHPHGPASNRSGFRFIGETKHYNKKCRLIPFEFSTEQAYILEFGDQYIRFWMNHGQIINPSSPHLLLHCNGNDASKQFPDSSSSNHTVTAHGNAQVDTSYKKFGSGSAIFDGNGDYLTVPDHVDWHMGSGRFTIDTWVRFENIAQSQPIFDQYVDTGNYVMLWWNYGIPEVTRLSFIIKFEGSQIVYIPASWFPEAHRWYHIALIRGWDNNDNKWALTVDGSAVGVIDDTSSWPDLNADFRIGRTYVGGILEEFHGWMDEIRVLKGGAFWTEDFMPPTHEYPPYGGGEGECGWGTPGEPYERSTPYLEEHLPLLKFVQSADTMWIVHPKYKPQKLTRTGHACWFLTEYVPTADPFIGADDYPACVAFFEERLAFAATNNEPQTIWLSKSGNFEDMTTGVNDDDGMKYTIAADQVNVIRWLSPGHFLMIGTVGGEWKLGSSDTRAPLTPTNVRADREATHGNANIQPARVGHVVLFLQRAGKKIRELAYIWEADNYVAPDLTLLAEHITKTTVKNFAYQQEPFSILWCVRSDGVLLGLTHKREQEVIAWHRHITDGNFENIAVIPGPEADELYAIVQREINGSTKRYIEMLESPFDDTDTESAFFVDSGLSYDGTPKTKISGLEHLEGKEVTILADGATHPNKTVSGASITLDREASKVHVGLGYTSVLQTMRLEAGVREGTAQGRIKRISKVVIRLFKTLGCKVGPDENTLDTIYFRDSSMPMDTPPDLFTGDKEIDYPEGYETDAHITVVQDLPLPITVVALMPRIRTAEGE